MIGDDANLIGAFTAMPGRIFSVAMSADGKRFAAGSSLDGKGQVDIYEYTFDAATTSDPIKKILAKDGPAAVAPGTRRAGQDPARFGQAAREPADPDPDLRRQLPARRQAARRGRAPTGRSA